MEGETLLSRDRFREGVFARDGHACVFCKEPAQDAHHIMERRLFPDGGYYLANGASVCAKHHIACEQTLISVEDVLVAAGITRRVTPPHLYPDQPYTKWGDPILENGQRAKGELFHDESVQKVLASAPGILDLYTDRIKYPRTHHLPWSAGVTDDDRVIEDMAPFRDERVVATEKLDGENTSLYPDGSLHARSVDGRSHPSRDRVKAFWAERAHDLPQGWRLCGENLFAQHSIRYEALESYLYGFSIWNERNECLGWDETVEWFRLLGVTPAPVLYDGLFDEAKIRALWTPADWERSEGYVLRVGHSFHYRAFRTVVAKFVRPRHVQTTKHWMHGQRIVPNLLKPRD